MTRSNVPRVRLSRTEPKSSHDTAARLLVALSERASSGFDAVEFNPLDLSRSCDPLSNVNSTGYSSRGAPALLARRFLTGNECLRRFLFFPSVFVTAGKLERLAE